MEMTPQALLGDLLTRIESGEIRVREVRIDNEVRDDLGDGACFPTKVLTGRQTIQIQIESAARDGRVYHIE